MSGIQVKALTSVMFLDKTLHPNIATIYKENIRGCSAIFFSTPKPRISVPGLTFSGCVSKMDVSQTKLI